MRFVKFVAFLTATVVFLASCIKGPDIVTNNQPLLPDTLGPGWQAVKIDTTLTLSDVFFTSPQKGFVCGVNYLARTFDGGLHWNETILPDSLRESFINLFFVDGNNGWATGSSFLLRTRDGGESWQKVTNGGVYDVQFFDANNGYITTYTDLLYKTNDGGVTARLINSSAGHSLYFRNPAKGWLSGNYLLRTADSGATLTNSTSAIIASSYNVQFTDSLHGWVGGPAIYRTLDGGATLETLATDINHGGDIFFFDNNNGYVLTSGNIYSTTDGGKTLTKACAIHKSELFEIYFTDNSHGWATGAGGYVYCYVKP